MGHDHNQRQRFDFPDYPLLSSENNCMLFGNEAKLFCTYKSKVNRQVCVLRLREGLHCVS